MLDLCHSGGAVAQEFRELAPQLIRKYRAARIPDSSEPDERPRDWPTSAPYAAAQGLSEPARSRTLLDAKILSVRRTPPLCDAGAWHYKFDNPTFVACRPFGGRLLWRQSLDFCQVRLQTGRRTEQIPLFLADCDPFPPVPVLPTLPRGPGPSTGVSGPLGRFGVPLESAINFHGMFRNCTLFPDLLRCFVHGCFNVNSQRKTALQSTTGCDRRVCWFLGFDSRC